jgi:hypothetical protein
VSMPFLERAQKTIVLSADENGEMSDAAARAARRATPFLALQLPFPFEMSAARFGLVGAAPE